MGRATTLLIGIVIGALAVAGLWAADRNGAAETALAERSVSDIAPPVETSPDPADSSHTAVPPAEKETVLRARCLLPEGVIATKVSAWFRADPDESNLNYPASIEGDVVTVRVPFGRGQLNILVEGCVVAEQMVDAADGRTSDIAPFKLERAHPLRGRVIDEDGVPVTDAFIWPKVGKLSVPLTSTDNDGQFTFEGLPAGEATLRVECDSKVRRIVKYAHAVDSEPIEIILSEGVRLRGQLLDDQGAPINAVYASVVDTAAPEDRSRMAFPSIRNDGTFEVRLAPGRYRVRVTHDGRGATETVDVFPGRDAVVTLRFEAE